MSGWAKFTEYVNMGLFIAQTEIKKLETSEREGVEEEKLEDNEWMRWEKAWMDEKEVARDEAREQVMQKDTGRRQKRWLYKGVGWDM